MTDNKISETEGLKQSNESTIKDNLQRLQKATIAVNFCLLMFVVMMEGLFLYYKINYMVYYSIFAISFYLISFVIIKKMYLTAYVWMLYGVITTYMNIATVCLGVNYGFQLYSMSLIPILFYIDYVAVKTHKRKIYSMTIALIIVACYLFSSCYSLINGPIYTISNVSSSIMWAINSVSVFAFLIVYTKTVVELVLNSEKKLTAMAQIDKLTGLYNRHYMMDYLTGTYNAIVNTDKQYIIAMSDIDNFKKINDTYGHNAGDYVLKRMSELIREVCSECTFARWGGEEFIYITSSEDAGVFEKLRSRIEQEKFVYDNNVIPVTITIGAARFNDFKSIDNWISRADEKLYYGKNNGKNVVIM